MSLTVENVSKANTKDYGTNMKLFVEAFMELYPDATLYQTVTNTTSKYEVYLKLGNTGWYLHLYNSSVTFYYEFGYFVDGSFKYIYVNYQEHILSTTTGYSLIVKKTTLNGAIMRFRFSNSVSQNSCSFAISTAKSVYDNKIYTGIGPFYYPSYIYGGDMTSAETLSIAFPSIIITSGVSVLAPVYPYGEGGTFFGNLTFGGALIYYASPRPDVEGTEFYCGSRRFMFLSGYYAIEIL